MGLTYVCDLFHDDQPGPVKVRKRPAHQHSLFAGDERRHRLHRQSRVAAPLWRDHPAAVRSPVRRGRGVGHGDVHPAAPLPHRPAATASRPSRRRSLHHRPRARCGSPPGARSRSTSSTTITMPSPRRRTLSARRCSRYMILPDDYLKYPKPALWHGPRPLRLVDPASKSQSPSWPGGARIALWVIAGAASGFRSTMQGQAVQAARARCSHRLSRPAALHAARLRQPRRHLPHHEGARAARHPRQRRRSTPRSPRAIRHWSRRCAARGWEILGHGLDMDRLHSRGAAHGGGGGR